MRISDWSSDVCSSDLLGVGRLIRPYQKPHPPIAVSLRAANSYTARQAGSRGWIPVSGNFIPAADVATHWPTYAAGAEEAGRRRAASGWRRSEEHTSELQALKRTSNAGFCLKKKKKI